MVFISTGGTEVAVPVDCDRGDGKNFCEAPLCTALLVHGAGGVPDQAGLVLGCGRGGSGREA